MTTVDELIRLPEDELDNRIRDAAARCRTRFERATSENRDLTARESELCADDRAELHSLRDAVECRAAARSEDARLESEAAARAQQLGRAMDTTPPPETRGALEGFITEVRAGRPVRIAVETRAISSENAGWRQGAVVQQLPRPRWIWDLASIPFARATDLIVSGPCWAALVSQEATEEAEEKPAMEDPDLAKQTLQPFAVTQRASDQVVRFGVGPTAITERLASESIFSVNNAMAAALEEAAGTAATFTGTPSQAADLAIGQVWAATSSRPTALLVNPADYPSLSDKSAAGPGDTVGAEVIRFNGVPLLVFDSITAGVAVAVAGGGFSAHATDVILASLPDLTTNEVLFLAETYAALLQHDKGAAAAVELGSSS